VRAATIVNGALTVGDHADPQPGAGEVLVRIQAAGLNNADLMQVKGLYPAPPGSPHDIPGLELAGEIVAAGPGATRFEIGDRVMAVVGGGAQAELLPVHERLLLPLPVEVDWLQAGGIPEAFTTAHDALFTQCGLAMGEAVLISGAAGGVGSAGVQLAVQAGARVTATVRNEQRRADVSALGAVAIDPADVHAHGPYDVVLELIGAPNMATNLQALTTGGRIAVIGVGGGARAEIDLLAIMGKRARIHGSTLRARPLEGKAAAARAMEQHVVPLFQTGRLRVPIAGSFPLEQVTDAYEQFAAGGKFGKIVLEMG